MKAVLFDFDGVLTTDATGSESICRYISKQTGIPQTDFEEVYYRYNDDLLYGKTTHLDIWPELCSALGRKIEIGILYDSFLSTPIDGKMISFVKQFKKQGYAVGMVTDNKKDRIDSIVDYYRWDQLFDIITVSAEIGSGKDNRQIFLHTVKALGVDAADCVFIDNQEKNLVVPQELGMQVIYFDEQRWRRVADAFPGIRY